MAKATVDETKPRDIMKMNKSQGLYFTTRSMTAFSDKKSKEYQTGMNIPAHQVSGFLTALLDGSLVRLANAFKDNKWKEVKL
jgi:hypothetical protein